ncbi:MAG: nuclear transport factor 2 family protein [Elusimicrobia bacterium]|nr:nuclear transport factor 2 family protein [Elusimicrobiota bacterium]
MRRGAFLALGALALSACIQVSFRRSATQEEAALQAEIRRTYWEVAAAFAAGDAEALAALFSPDISHPMTQGQIRDWARDFFARNGRARFHVTELSFDELGYTHAVVTLKYRVDPAKPEGAFGGTETDRLDRRQGRWAVTSWDRGP